MSSPSCGDHGDAVLRIDPRADKCEIFVRMPSDLEREQLRIGEGVPVFVIEREGQHSEIYAADHTVITVGEEEVMASPHSTNTCDQRWMEKVHSTDHAADGSGPVSGSGSGATER